MTARNADDRIHRESEDRISQQINDEFQDEATLRIYNMLFWETDVRIRSETKIILKNHNKKEKT